MLLIETKKLLPRASLWEDKYWNNTQIQLGIIILNNRFLDHFFPLVLPSTSQAGLPG